VRVSNKSIVGAWVAQSVWLLPSAQVMIPGSGDQVPHRASCPAGSLLLPLTLPPPSDGLCLLLPNTCVISPHLTERSGSCCPSRKSSLAPCSPRPCSRAANQSRAGISGSSARQPSGPPGPPGTHHFLGPACDSAPPNPGPFL